MDGGPWIFRYAPIIIQEYDGFTDVSEYKLNKVPLWARLKGLPEGLTAKKELAEKSAAKVGEPPCTVIVNEGKINPASALRVRVFVDVSTPLVRCVPITLKELRRYPVFYDRLPDFCFFCGLMGHTVEECGDGIHDPRTCEWGEWLLWGLEQPTFVSGGGGNLDGRGGGAGQQEEGEEVEGKGEEDVRVLEGRGICMPPAWAMLSKSLLLIIPVREKDLYYQMER